ncbi:aldehyde dehydrogenase family protein [uncultured Roseibium sp.]|uniref:aldehyde dehydrogenase family protein n=1 Tax=uncultured Roseibium sp. TaxID=1936171 RepID=UPI0025943467|nr:aldehyde dehydrogenase family protein [uncultured Roseibium sp.]
MNAPSIYDHSNWVPAPYSDFDLQPIAGEWRKGASGEMRADTNPFTGETLVEIAGANADDVDKAYEAAAEAQKAWAAKPASERSNVLDRAADIVEARREELINWLVTESGSTVIKAGMEVQAAIGIMRTSATFPQRAGGKLIPSDVPGKESRVYREALGVIGVISPWNFPFHLSMRSVAPALALGNAVVLKPASDAPVTGGLLLGKIFEEAGLPKALLSVVTGPSGEIGDHFVEHKIPQLISFTGSTPVGRNLAKLATGGEWLKRIALELGGNGPIVVLDDADVEQAAHATVVGRFLHQGQICMSTNRAIVDASIHDAFVEAVVKRTKALKAGDPQDPETVVGPIINASQVKSVQEVIRKAREDGATEVLSGETEGNVVPPHVFTDVRPEWSIARDESFGPVLPILKARDEAHALELANDTDFGLSSAVFSGDRERGVAFARGIRAGMTHVNDITVADEPEAPFGGEKNSGLGRFNGEWVLEEFTRTHWVTVQSTPRDYPF